MAMTIDALRIAMQCNAIGDSENDDNTKCMEINSMEHGHHVDIRDIKTYHDTYQHNRSQILAKLDGEWEVKMVHEQEAKDISSEWGTSLLCKSSGDIDNLHSYTTGSHAPLQKRIDTAINDKALMETRSLHFTSLRYHHTHTYMI
jgi:hypothetical protein